MNKARRVNLEILDQLVLKDREEKLELLELPVSLVDRDLKVQQAQEEKQVLEVRMDLLEHPVNLDQRVSFVYIV